MLSIMDFVKEWTLKNNMVMEENLITHYVGDIELSMTLEDAHYCSHQGDCDDDVTEVSLKPYIQKQLKEYSNPQLIKALKEYAIEDCDKFNRKQLEEYIVWLIAGNIIDDE